MRKQSSTIYYRGQTHNEIFFDGHYHDAMYIGNQLVWEKLAGLDDMPYSPRYGRMPFGAWAKGKGVVYCDQFLYYDFNKQVYPSIYDYKYRLAQYVEDGSRESGVSWEQANKYHFQLTNEPRGNNYRVVTNGHDIAVFYESDDGYFYPLRKPTDNDDCFYQITEDNRMLDTAHMNLEYPAVANLNGIGQYVIFNGCYYQAKLQNAQERGWNYIWIEKFDMNGNMISQTNQIYINDTSSYTMFVEKSNIYLLLRKGFLKTDTECNLLDFVYTSTNTIGMSKPCYTDTGTYFVMYESSDTGLWIAKCENGSFLRKRLGMTLTEFNKSQQGFFPIIANTQKKNGKYRFIMVGNYQCIVFDDNFEIIKTLAGIPRTNMYYAPYAYIPLSDDTIHFIGTTNGTIEIRYANSYRVSIDNKPEKNDEIWLYTLK